MVQEEGKELLQSLRVHLKSADTEKILKNWKGCAPKPGDVDIVGPALIQQRLQAVILQWATAEPSPFTKASKRITEKYKTMKTEIELRFGAIQNLELGFNLKESLIQTEDLSGGNIVLIFLTSPIWIAVGVVGLVLGIIPLAIWGISRLVRSKEFSIAAMTKMTERVMNKLFVTDALNKFITDSFILPHRELLTKLVVDTKCKRDSTLEMIHELEKDFHLTSDTIMQLSSLQVTLNECCKCLQDLKKDIQIPYLDPYL